MGQVPETTPAHSFAPRVGGTLLLSQWQGTPDHLLLGPPEVPELIKQDFFKEYILTPEAASEH